MLAEGPEVFTESRRGNPAKSLKLGKKPSRQETADSLVQRYQAVIVKVIKTAFRPASMNSISSKIKICKRHYSEGRL